LRLLQLFERHSLGAVHACPSRFLHVPVASQVLVPVQESGSSALTTATQVPPAPVQAWQGPQLWLQQKLSTQSPVAQSPSVGVQLSPFFFLHAPTALQVFGPVQVSVSSAPTTASQVPPAPVQAWQVPQVWLQQWSSMHVPVAHSPPVSVQLPPFLFLHAPAALQVLVPMQAVPVVSSALETVMLQVPPAPQFVHSGQLDCVQHTPSKQVSPA
jgi:hypothetical protein